MRKYLNIKSLLILIGVSALLLTGYLKDEQKIHLVHIEGMTMGTIRYAVSYIDPEKRDFRLSIDSLLNAFNNSLSTYISSSEISRLNAAKGFRFESKFMLPVLKASQAIYSTTNGAFDPTVGPLINAWGFGKEPSSNPNDAKIDSLLALVGYKHVFFNEDSVWKADKRISLDFSAIAKGYAVDLLAELLKKNGVSNLMVEIGGEVTCAGINDKGKPWRIGIDDPMNVSNTGRQLKASVLLKDRSLATSGNYRNFYVKSGKKYAHTISPYNGFPVTHSLLSASVFAQNCMIADAVATGMMVLGLEKSIEIANKDEQIDIFLIYGDENGKIKTYLSDGIKDDLIVLPPAE